MLQKVSLYAMAALVLFATSCNTPYHAAKRKKGEQCDCPKSTKHKVRRAKKHP